jgi:hypothetical protein
MSSKPPNLDELETVHTRIPGYMENIFGPEVAAIYVPRMEGIEPSVVAQVVVNVIRRRAAVHALKTYDARHWLSAGLVWSLLFGIPATYLTQVFFQNSVFPNMLSWNVGTETFYRGTTGKVAGYIYKRCDGQTIRTPKLTDQN